MKLSTTHSSSCPKVVGIRNKRSLTAQSMVKRSKFSKNKFQFNCEIKRDRKMETGETKNIYKIVQLQTKARQIVGCFDYLEFLELKNFPFLSNYKFYNCLNKEICF